MTRLREERLLEQRNLGGTFVALAAGALVASCSGASGSSSRDSAHDTFAATAGATQFSYDCPMQAVEKMSDVVLSQGGSARLYAAFRS